MGRDGIFRRPAGDEQKHPGQGHSDHEPAPAHQANQFGRTHDHGKARHQGKG